MRHVWRRLAFLLACLSFAGLGQTRAMAAAGGVLTLEVVDRDTREPLACRIHLWNANKKAIRPPRVPFWHDHFVFSGSITLKLPKGEYAFEMERGPEYLVRGGHFSVSDNSKDTSVVDLKRFVDMSKEGWWSGDVDVRRPAKDLELLMLAEDLHVAELVTWPSGKSLLAKGGLPKNPIVEFQKNYFYHLAAGADTRAGGSLLFFNLAEPLDLAGYKADDPPQNDSIRQAKEQSGAWVDAQFAYGWDVPTWVATAQLDSIQLANSNLARKSAVNTEGAGKPRDKFLYPDPSGNGRWNERVYYHLLNCGLRIPPTAGSGSGVMANPLGYNRVYVHVEGQFSYQKWWDSLREGKAVVTNGPLIRPNVGGELPGHVFRALAGEEVELEVGLTLSTRDRVSYLEVIKNGDPVQQVRLDEFAKAGGKLPGVRFKESGWLLLRAVTDVPETYRFASTAPYYVEIGSQRRISKASGQFFLDWVIERGKKLQMLEAPARDAAIELNRQAQDYWRRVVENANAP